MTDVALLSIMVIFRPIFRSISRTISSKKAGFHSKSNHKYFLPNFRSISLPTPKSCSSSGKSSSKETSLKLFNSLLLLSLILAKGHIKKQLLPFINKNSMNSSTFLTKNNLKNSSKSKLSTPALKKSSSISLPFSPAEKHRKFLVLLTGLPSKADSKFFKNWCHSSSKSFTTKISPTIEPPTNPK